jgi:RHS repeat-associated protein
MKYYHYGQLEDVVLTTDETGQGVAFTPGLAETGLRLYGLRLYDGWLGRFLMPDTIIPNLYEPQSHNPYSYCHNDPVNYIDPSGHYRRVPRMFPYGDMPTPRANLLVGGLQIASVVIGSLVSFGFTGNVAFGKAAAITFDIAINAVVPTLLSPERNTTPRWRLIQRLVVDIASHSAVAFGGFKANRLLGVAGKMIPLLVANSGMILGGMWSSQVGGLMKSFGMGYNLGALWPALGRREYAEIRATDTTRNTSAMGSGEQGESEEPFSSVAMPASRRRSVRLATVLPPEDTNTSSSQSSGMAGSDVVNLALRFFPDLCGFKSTKEFVTVRGTIRDLSGVRDALLRITLPQSGDSDEPLIDEEYVLRLVDSLHDAGTLMWQGGRILKIGVHRNEIWQSAPDQLDISCEVNGIKCLLAMEQLASDNKIANEE